MWIALGHTDMRKGMQGLALLVQQSLQRDPHGGDLFVFRGRSGALLKIIWHGGIGMSLYAKRLERGRFVWLSAKDGTVSLTGSQLAEDGCLKGEIAYDDGDDTTFTAEPCRFPAACYNTVRPHSSLGYRTPTTGTDDPADDNALLSARTTNKGCSIARLHSHDNLTVEPESIQLGNG